MEIKEKIVAIILVLLVSGCTENNQIINISDLPILTEASDTLNVKIKTDFHVFCTGELKPDWANAERKYIGQDDDVELLLKLKNGTISKIIFKESDKTGDTLMIEKGGVKCFQYYDKAQRKYFYFLTISRYLIIETTSIEFDLAIGDNDDGIKQKAKLCWANNRDPLALDIIGGRLLLVEKKPPSLNPQAPNIAYAVNISDKAFKWENASNFQIKNTVAGQFNDDDDFSGQFKVAWDSNNIYLRIEINDSKERKFENKSMLKDDNFVDKGWIEDLKGKKIWQMSIIHAKHGGGSLKNQYCDTIITLNPGKYIVRYTTDESHSWNNWDARPPKNNFWGIRIESKQLK